MRHLAAARPLVTCIPFVAALCLAAGCSESSTMTPSDLGGTPPDLVPLVCNGAFSNAVNGTFRPCDAEVTFLSSDQSIRFYPRGYVALQGQPQPLKIFLNFVAKPAFKVQTYTRDTLADGTIVQVQDAAHLALFSAERTVDDMTMQRTDVGAIELTLRSLPKDPGTGNSWFDTNVHGSLTAELPLGANQPGRPGDTVNVVMEF